MVNKGKPELRKCQGIPEKSSTHHILHTRVCFVHEFEKFVNDGLQELPVCLTESVKLRGSNSAKNRE